MTGSVEEQVIVGLGNPGPDYRGTRHNIGFACLEELAFRLQLPITRRRWQAYVGSGEVGGRRIYLVQPQTFMNESGLTVAKALKDLGVKPANLWVVHDELDLPLGRMRIKVGGSAAGHNGIRSIISNLGGNDGFVRFRVGVDKPPGPGHHEGVAHVLSRFRGADEALSRRVIRMVADSLEVALELGVERAMDRFNRPEALEEVAEG